MRTRPATSVRRGSAASERSRLLAGLVLAFVLLSAALLRFYGLDAQSFWNDEGNSARIAERSLDLIIEGAAGDVHPPGYYLLLHVWRGLFGQSEFALRSLSVVAGLVMVVFTGLLARQLSGAVVGLVAASLGALSPLAIYYSQEARMYALLGAISAAAAVVSFRALAAVGRRAGELDPISQNCWSAAYILINGAGLYTHYAFVFVLVAHNVAFGLVWLAGWLRSRPDWRALVRWTVVQLGTGLLFLPWVPTALNAAGWSSAGGDYQLGTALADVLRVLTVGVTQSLDGARLALWLVGALLVVGLWPRTDGSGGKNGLDGWLGIAGLLAYLLVPCGLFFAFDLYKPAWLKFLVVLLPTFHVVAARGIANVAALVSRVTSLEPSRRHRVRSIASMVLVVAYGVLVYPSLHNLYFDSAYARDDYRQLAADIREMRRPGDAIVLNAPNQWEVFTYYYPDQDVYPAPYRPGPGRAASFLSPLVEEYERLFVVYWGDAESDPRRRVESWLADHAYKASDRWYGDVRLATYGLAPQLVQPAVSVEALFGGRILLSGYAIVGDAFSPGDVVPVTFFWQAVKAVDEPYKVSVQMLDPSGGERLVSQMDTVPGDGLAPTTSWQPGVARVDRYGVQVPAGTRPGAYDLIVAVYHQLRAERLPVVVEGEPRGDHLSLGEISVQPGRE